MMTVNCYLENANCEFTLIDRMNTLTKLCYLPKGAQFYAHELNLSSGDINALKYHEIIREVEEESKKTTICIDYYNNLYKEVTIKCWTVVNNKTLIAKCKEYYQHKISLFSEFYTMIN